MGRASPTQDREKGKRPMARQPPFRGKEGKGTGWGATRKVLVDIIEGNKKEKSERQVGREREIENLLVIQV